MMVREIERRGGYRGWKPERLLRDPLAELIYHLERAVAGEGSYETAEAVKKVLEDSIRRHGSFIPERFLQPANTGYARRLIYLGADRRFSVLAMVWAPGQGTPLHDHGGDWCVECVYSGAVRATAFEPTGEDRGVFTFSQTETTFDVEGQAHALVPPFEHHVLENISETTAVTLHVYANELTRCNAYFPVDGGFVRESCDLGYTL